MTKYVVASATMVLNKEENLKIVIPGCVNRMIMQNAEMSDATRCERQVAATMGHDNAPNAAPIANGAINKVHGAIVIHAPSIGMFENSKTNVLHETRARGHHS